MKRAFFVVLLSIILSGCVAQSRNSANDRQLFTYKKFNAPLEQEMEVETGETLFVEGAFIEGEAIRIDKPLDLMIPGSMLIPFPAHIDSGDLILSRITPKWKYYCGSMDKVAASFPGLGSVIRNGDCVGIRIAVDGSDHEWVVDNSNYNRGWGETIYSMNMSSEDKEIYKPLPIKRPFDVDYLKQITFDGFYGGQLHFNWKEITSQGTENKDFIFDFQGEPTLVSVKGNRFVVLSADNIKLRFKWKAFN